MVPGHARREVLILRMTEIKIRSTGTELLHDKAPFHIRIRCSGSERVCGQEEI